MGNLVTLSGRQSFFLEKMSQLIVRESSDDGHTSLDSEIEASDWEKDSMVYVDKMAKSTNEVD